MSGFKQQVREATASYNQCIQELAGMFGQRVPWQVQVLIDDAGCKLTFSLPPEGADDERD